MGSSQTNRPEVLILKGDNFFARKGEVTYFDQMNEFPQALLLACSNYNIPLYTMQAILSKDQTTFTQAFPANARRKTLMLNGCPESKF